MEDDFETLFAGKGEERTSAKPVLSVTFIDAQGTPHAFAYSHLYRITVKGGALVVAFSGHEVTLEGRKLYAPAKDCLMRRLAQHKVEFVEVRVRPDFAEGEVVTSVTVTELG